jgi:hypothetical protein
MRKISLLLGGACCLACSLGLAILLFYYVTHGAGLQLFHLGVSLIGVLLGLIHVIGLTVGSVIFFAFGSHFFSQGLDKKID